MSLVRRPLVLLWHTPDLLPLVHPWCASGPPEEDEEEGDGAGEGDSAMSHDGDEGEGAEDAAVQDDAAHVFSGHTGQPWGELQGPGILRPVTSVTAPVTGHQSHPSMVTSGRWSPLHLE